MRATLFVVVVTFSAYCSAKLQEPSCGTLEIFERLLTKMLNLEHKVDSLEASMFNREENANASDALPTWTQLQEQSDVITTKLDAALQKHEQEAKAVQAAYKTPNVVFTATRADDTDVIEGEVIKFTTFVINVGGGYDPGTGKFTAPHAGLYLFTVTVCAQYKQSVYVYLMAADTVLGATRKFNNDADGTCTSISGMAMLSRGDQARVQGSATRTGALLDTDNRWNSFSGMLVHT